MQKDIAVKMILRAMHQRKSINLCELASELNLSPEDTYAAAKLLVDWGVLRMKVGDERQE
jgi:predicted transcriptional regulator